MSITPGFPQSWRVTVTVLRSGGRDPKGDPLPETPHQVADCLMGWRATTDPVDRADLTSDTAVLYAPMGSDFESTDRVEIPGSGVWRVDGMVKPWPMGTEIPLARGGRDGNR